MVHLAVVKDRVSKMEYGFGVQSCTDPHFRTRPSTNAYDIVRPSNRGSRNGSVTKTWSVSTSEGRACGLAGH